MEQRGRAPLASTSSPAAVASSVARSVPIGVNTSLSGVASSSARVLLPPMPIWVQPAALRLSRCTRTRPRARTSSERGQLFRQRQKQYVDELETSIRQLREQISGLRASTTGLTREVSLLVRTNDWGSLVQLTREFYTVFRYGLEACNLDDQHQPKQPDLQAIQATERCRQASAQYKESFLRQVMDPDVEYGSLVGVDALINQWFQHTASYSQFEIELGHAECIARHDDANPVVLIQTHVHAQFSRESLLVMFPFAEGRGDLIQAFIDRDLTFACVSWLEFSKTGRIVTYNVQVNYVEALVMAVGSARLVAELMEFSVVTPDSVLISPEERSLEAADDYAPMVAADQFRGGGHRARSLGMHDLLSDSSDSETKGEEEHGGYFADHRRCSDGYAPSAAPPASVFYNNNYGYGDGDGDDGVSHVVQL